MIYISLPVRLHPWVIAEMVDISRTPDYLFEDFIKPAWHLDGQIGKRISRLIAPIAVRVLRSLDPVSVDRNRGWCREAFQKSLELLVSGESLLIFPEQPAKQCDPVSQIRPFLGGFCWLSQMYYKSTGKALAIQPMAVFPPGRRMIIASPEYLNLHGNYRKAIDRSVVHLEATVKRKYQEISSLC